MAIRPTGSYVSKTRSGKRKSKSKENKYLRYKQYNLVTSVYGTRIHGQTAHPKPKGKVDITPFLLGRNFSVNQADLEQKDPSEITEGSYRNFEFKVNRIVGNDCRSVFNGMEVTPEKINQMIKKRHTLVETHCEVTTGDMSRWRVFINATTKRRSDELCSYLKTSQVKQIRKIVCKVVQKNCEGVEIDKFTKILGTENISKEIEMECSKIYPMNVLLRKVKPVKNMACARSMAVSPSPVDKPVVVETVE